MRHGTAVYGLKSRNQRPHHPTGHPEVVTIIYGGLRENLRAVRDAKKCQEAESRSICPA